MANESTAGYEISDSKYFYNINQVKARNKSHLTGKSMVNLLLTIIFAYGSFVCTGANAFVLASSVVSTPSTSSSSTSTSTSPSDASPISIVKKVAVAGATGRTGSLVVEELVKRNVDVVALVRDLKKAKEKLPETKDIESTSTLTVIKCDLGSENEIEKAIEGCDAAIWCATGFSDAPGVSLFTKIQSLLGITLAPKKSIDVVGVPALGRAFLKSDSKTSTSTGENNACLPKVVMLSSAGVTRPSWDDEKKSMFPGAADIPIVRLNPFGILDIKRESEEDLRKTGVDYCIVRPCGLNNDWPSNARPVFSQGDVAVGRINRIDVATLLVDTLYSPDSVGKTFEAVTLTGYPPATSIDNALSRLIPDSEGVPSNDVLQVTYGMMQQLLPGETQDAAKLAMGQTYEELDKGVTGRLGKRGDENAESVAPKPSS